MKYIHLILLPLLALGLAACGNNGSESTAKSAPESSMESPAAEKMDKAEEGTMEKEAGAAAEGETAAPAAEGEAAAPAAEGETAAPAAEGEAAAPAAEGETAAPAAEGEAAAPAAEGETAAPAAGN